MKASILFYLMILMIIIDCAAQESTPIEGAWQVVSCQRIVEDSLIYKFLGNIPGSEIKIRSKNHFLYVGRYKIDTTFIDNYGGGTYKIEGNHYEENILYSSNQNAVGTMIRMLLEIKNDTLIQTWPVDENWQVIKRINHIQKWTRLE